MLKILVIADSTAMWIRPYRNHIDELTYIEYLRKENIEVDVITTPGLTSKEVINIYWNQLGASFYDFYIVSVGINDLTPRSYFRWMWKIENNLIVKYSLFAKFYTTFYRIFTNHYIQKLFSKYKISRPWVSLEEFELNLSKFKEMVLKESDAKIIYFSYPNVSNRISSLLYGIDENIMSYREVFNHLKNNKRVFVLDIDKLFESNRDKYNIEGIHYTSIGHKKIFNKLLEILIKEKV